MTLSVPEILEELRELRGYFPIEAVEAAIERRDEMVPELLRILDDAADRPAELLARPAEMAPIYALYLLAQFREPAAYPRIVRLFRLPDEAGVELTGEVATEALDRMLATLNFGDLQPIYDLIEDPGVNDWVRGAGLEALEEMVVLGQLSREEAVGYLGELFGGKLERDDSTVWSCLVSVATDLHATELAPQVRRAFDDGLVDRYMVTREEVEEELAEPRGVVLRRTRRRCKGPIDDIVKEMSWWACFHEPALWARSGADAEPPLPIQEPVRETGGWRPAEPVRRKEPKVGRNEPCPCGSGKKYKRCCGSRASG
jgi:hypothetical protein